MLQIVRTTFFVSVFLLACEGFLIDGNTPLVPTDGSVLTDKHYNFLMQFIFQERQSRLQLETMVTNLQQQLAATETDLTGKIKDLEKCGCQGKDHVITMHNKTDILEDKLAEITKQYETMKVQFISLQQEHLVTVNTSVQLEKDIAVLKQLKVVSDARTILDLQNSTKHLEKEIQKTNSKQAALESDANARKQDFLALFQKVQMSEKDLLHSLNETNINSTNRIQTLETNLQSSNTSIQSALNILSSHLTTLSTAVNFNNRSIQSGMNTLSSQLTTLSTAVDSNNRSIESTQEIISNRVVLSAWTGGATVASGDTIPFTTVITSHGIKDLTSMRNSGIFTCEKTGYYLITFFITTKSATGQMCIYVNTSIKACASKHADTNYQTHTAIYLEHLNVHDTVDVRVHGSGSLNVYSTYDSIFSVLQVV